MINEDRWIKRSFSGISKILGSLKQAHSNYIKASNKLLYRLEFRCVLLPLFGLLEDKDDKMTHAFILLSFPSMTGVSFCGGSGCLAQTVGVVASGKEILICK